MKRLTPANPKRSPFALKVEDRFLIFTLREKELTFDGINDISRLRDLLDRLKPPFDTMQRVFDFKGVSGLYGDFIEFAEEIVGNNPTALVNSMDQFRDWMDENEFPEQSFRLKPIVAKGTSIQGKSIPVRFYEEDSEFYMEKAIETQAANGLLEGIDIEKMPEDSPATDILIAQSMDDEYSYALDEAHFLQQADFQTFVSSQHRHSLLVEFAFSSNGGSIQLIPYHAGGIHNVYTPDDSVLVSRPAKLSKLIGATFKNEIEEFEQLINCPKVREHTLQKFLEVHPHFLCGMNYCNVYPQLVLQREDSGPLRPDFILEPFEGGFCDILDIKLPTQRLAIGRKDRAALAAGIHEVVAQLREYSAYFDQDRYRKFAQEKYGLKVYRPRLIAIVGRDMRQMESVEFRRAITHYNDFQIITFDELLKHAKRRLLI